MTFISLDMMVNSLKKLLFFSCLHLDLISQTINTCKCFSVFYNKIQMFFDFIIIMASIKRDGQIKRIPPIEVLDSRLCLVCCNRVLFLRNCKPFFYTYEKSNYNLVTMKFTIYSASYLEFRHFYQVSIVMNFIMYKPI